MSRRQIANQPVLLAKFLFSRTLDHMELNGVYPISLIYSHIARYLFAARFCKGKSCLDVACGSGYGSQLLFLSGADRVVGGDVQYGLLQRASQHLLQPGLSFVCLNAGFMPFKDLSFDVVISFETIEHLAHPCEFLRQVARILKSDGIFVCSTPNGAVSSPHPSSPRNAFHFREYALSEFEGMLSRHFGHVLILGQGTISKNDIRLSRAARFFKRVGARYGFFDRLLSVASAVFRREWRYLQLEEAIADVKESNTLFGYDPYDLSKAGGKEPLSFVAFARKPQ